MARKRWHRAGVEALAAAAIAAFLYAGTLAPGVGAGDSAELTLAAQSLGVPHPPGYPIWTMLARIAAMLPVGSLPARVNALSAFLAAVAVGLFHMLARRAGLRALPAAIGTALFGSSVLVWRAAVEAEVYALATVWFLLLVWLALRARSRREGSPQNEALYFFAAGLSATVHQTLVFPAFFLGVWVLASEPRPIAPFPRLKPKGWIRLARAFVFSFAGLSAVLFVAVRSAGHPAFLFGGEPGLTGAVQGLLRRGYGALRQGPLHADLVVREIGGMASVVASSIGLAGALLAVAGALLSRRVRAPLTILTIAALTIPVALIAILSFTPDAEHFAQVAPFLAPVAVLLSLLAGAGAQGLLRRAPTLLRMVGTPALAACAIATVVAHQAWCDRSGFRLPERYAEDLLRNLPQGATLVLDGDNETFLTAYATRVAGIRPDIELIHRRGYVFGDPYGIRRAPRSEWVAIAHRAELLRLETGDRPLYYVNPPEDLASAGVRFIPEGLVSRAVAPSTRAVADRHDGAETGWLPPEGWPKSCDLLPGGSARYDYVTRKLAVSYSDAAGRALWEAGRPADAFPWLEDAARVGFDFPEAHLNLSTAAAVLGRPELALDELLRARTLAPFAPEPAARLAAFLGAAGRHKDAALWFERAYEMAPNAALASDAARAWRLAGDGARARFWRGLTG
jgi:Protein of unknown function (DUF2723)